MTESLNSLPRNLGKRWRSDEGRRLRRLPGPGFTRRPRILPGGRKPDHVPHPGPGPEDRKFPSRQVPDPHCPRKLPKQRILSPRSHPDSPGSFTNSHTVNELPSQLKCSKVLVPNTGIQRDHVVLGCRLAAMARMQTQNWSWNLGSQCCRDTATPHR
jgi:hypothetical protein